MSVPTQNPYADFTKPTPQFSPQAAPPTGQIPYPVGVWSRGKIVVFHKAAEFPDVCVKSGLPAMGSRFRKKLTWHPPWIIVTLFIGLPVYLILAVIMTKSVKADVGALPKYKTRRLMHLLIGWIMVFAALAAFVGGIALLDVDSEVAGAISLVSAVALLIGGVVFLAFMSRLVYPTKITDQYVYLKGCHPDFIKQLPACPFAYDL